MSHEGTHYNGIRVEALAHQQGGVTYASILKEYGISGDKNFANSIISALKNPESWKENTGSSDYWRVLSNGNIVFDGK